MACGFSSLAQTMVLSAPQPTSACLTAWMSSARADEGNRHRIHRLLDAELQVRIVFLGERGNAEQCPGHVDALVFAQRPTIHHLAQHVFALDVEHLDREPSVGEQNAVARTDFARELMKGGGDEFGGSGNLARGDSQAPSWFKQDGLAIAQPPGAHLGPL